jgi:hypothetical protein
MTGDREIGRRRTRPHDHSGWNRGRWCVVTRQRHCALGVRAHRGNAQRYRPCRIDESPLNACRIQCNGDNHNWIYSKCCRG